MNLLYFFGMCTKSEKRIKSINSFLFNSSTERIGFDLKKVQLKNLHTKMSNHFDHTNVILPNKFFFEILFFILVYLLCDLYSSFYFEYGIILQITLTCGINKVLPIRLTYFVSNYYFSNNNE